MKWEQKPLGEFAVARGGSVDPSKFKNETFELLSIPAFDAGTPDICMGAEIGSSKKCVEPNDVLISKIVPHIRRCWIVPPKTEHRQIASGEWIQFRTEKLMPEFLRHFLISEPSTGSSWERLPVSEDLCYAHAQQTFTNSKSPSRPSPSRSASPPSSTPPTPSAPNANKPSSTSTTSSNPPSSPSSATPSPTRWDGRQFHSLKLVSL